jgi:Flp pilus assembly protein TadD
VKRLSTFVFPVLAFVLPFSLYLLTLAPGFVSTDGSEFALCIHYWGVCHPPGFPLYIAAGHFFVNIFPFGSLIYKVNLLSALYGAGACFFVYLTLVKVGIGKANKTRSLLAGASARRDLVPFLVALLLAVVPDFWRLSVYADVFSFGAFLLSLAFFLLFSGRKFWSFFVLGLSASHMYTTGFLWPVFVVYCWPVGKIGKIREIWGKWLIAGAVFGLGLFPQALMFWRMSANPLVNWDHVTTFNQFVDFVRRKEFGGFFLLANSQLHFKFTSPIGHLFLLLWKLTLEYLVVLPLGFVAALFAIDLKKNKELLVLLASFVILTTLQVLSLGTIDPFVGDILAVFDIGKFYPLIFVIFSLCLGLVCRGIYAEHYAEPRRAGKQRLTLLYMVLIVSIIVNLLIGWKANNYAGNYYSQNYISDAFDQLPKRALVITYDHPFYFGARYWQEIEGKRRDVDILYITTNNPDARFYRPDLLGKPSDRKLVEEFKDADVNPTKVNVLDAVSRNPDRDIYFLISTPVTFYDFMDKYSQPHGLFVRFAKHPADKLNSLLLNSQFRNKGITKDSLANLDQKLQADVYAYVFTKAAEEYAKSGDFDKATILVNKARDIDQNSVTTNAFFSSLSEIANESGSFEEDIKNQNVQALGSLGAAYYQLKYFKGSARVFEALIKIDPKNPYYYTNAGSSYASFGDKVKAREFFGKALGLDSGLELARQGIKQLGE